MADLYFEVCGEKLPVEEDLTNIEAPLMRLAESMDSGHPMKQMAGMMRFIRLLVAESAQDKLNELFDRRKNGPKMEELERSIGTVIESLGKESSEQSSPSVPGPAKTGTQLKLDSSSQVTARTVRL